MEREREEQQMAHLLSPSSCPPTVRGRQPACECLPVGGADAEQRDASRLLALPPRSDRRGAAQLRRRRRQRVVAAGAGGGGGGGGGGGASNGTRLSSSEATNAPRLRVGVPGTPSPDSVSITMTATAPAASARRACQHRSQRPAATEHGLGHWPRHAPRHTADGATQPDQLPTWCTRSHPPLPPPVGWLCAVIWRTMCVKLTSAPRSITATCPEPETQTPHQCTLAA